MKKFQKILFAFSTLALISGVSACDKEPELTPEEIVDSAKASLVYNTSELAALISDLDLITELEGVKITYVSSDPTVISISDDGTKAIVHRASFEDGDKVARLTATLTYGDISVTKSWNVKVLKEGNKKTIAEFLNLKSATGSTIVVEGYVVAINAKGIYVNDNTGYVYAFDSNILTENSLVVGDYVQLEGGYAAYKGVPQFSYNATDGGVAVTKLSEKPDWTYTTPTPEVYDGAKVDTFLNYGEAPTDATLVAGHYIEATGVLTISGSYYNLTVPGATVGNKGLSLVYPSEDLASTLADLNGKMIKVHGYTLYNSGSYVNLFTTDAVEVTVTDEEKLNTDKDMISIASEVKDSITLPTTGSYGSTISWTSNNEAIAIDSENKATVTQGDEAVEVTLTATITLNGSSTTRTFTVTVKALDKANLQVLKTKPVVGTAYKFGTYQHQLSSNIYLTGEMNSYYYGCSENVAEAVDIYIEDASTDDNGAFKMYFNDTTGDAVSKKYLGLVSSTSGNKTFTNVKFLDETDTVFTFNSEYNAVVTNFNGSDYYLGTYDKSSTGVKTISASLTEYIDATSNTSMISHFYYEVSKYGDESYPNSVAQAVNVTKDLDNKNWNTSAVGYVTGVVTEITYSETYKNYTIIIKDSTDAEESFTVYGASFAEDVEVAEVGDTIIAYGTYYKYNSTYEFSGNKGTPKVDYPTVVKVVKATVDTDTAA